MFTGLLIKESLADTSLIKQLAVTNTRVEYPDNITTDQPKAWTLVTFRAEDYEAKNLSKVLASSLKEGQWYANFTTGDGRVFVVFPKHVSTYRAGSKAGRSRAQEYAQSIGIPPNQLDWTE